MGTLRFLSSILIFMFLASPVLIFAQTSGNIAPKNTSLIAGFVNEDCFVGKSVSSYCSRGTDKSLSKNTLVFVSGVITCTGTYSSDRQFYEIVYNRNTYYIEREKLDFVEDMNREPGTANVYDRISSMTEEQSELLRTNAKELSEMFYKASMKKALKFLDSCKTKGLAILNWSYYDESEHTDGTSASIEVYNPTTKTIKYIWITFVGFNPVGDKVVDRRRKTSNITVKGVGPIRPNDGGKYKYEYVWFTDLVETAKITTIKVQYMDGSIKTISNPKGIMLDKKFYDIISED
jgi:hypothetical protein